VLCPGPVAGGASPPGNRPFCADFGTSIDLADRFELFRAYFPEVGKASTYWPAGGVRRSWPKKAGRIQRLERCGCGQACELSATSRVI